MDEELLKEQVTDLEKEYTDEEKDFLNQLEMEEDAEITIEDKAQREAALKQQAATLEAVLPFAAKGVGFVNGILKAKDKRLSFDEQEETQLTGAIAPVLIKYGAEPPPWLAEYGPELTLLATVSIIGFGKYAMMQEIQKEEALKRAAIIQAAKAQGGTHAAAPQ
ncbi:hypothetical protein ACW0FS_004322 [Vibrio vulnificus]